MLLSYDTVLHTVDVTQYRHATESVRHERTDMGTNGQKTPSIPRPSVPPSTAAFGSNGPATTPAGLLSTPLEPVTDQGVKLGPDGKPLTDRQKVGTMKTEGIKPVTALALIIPVVIVILGVALWFVNPTAAIIVGIIVVILAGAWLLLRAMRKRKGKDKKSSNNGSNSRRSSGNGRGRESLFNRFRNRRSASGRRPYGSNGRSSSSHDRGRRFGRNRNRDQDGRRSDRSRPGLLNRLRNRRNKNRDPSRHSSSNGNSHGGSNRRSRGGLLRRSDGSSRFRRRKHSSGGSHGGGRSHGNSNGSSGGRRSHSYDGGPNNNPHRFRSKRNKKHKWPRWLKWKHKRNKSVPDQKRHEDEKRSSEKGSPWYPKWKTRNGPTDGRQSQPRGRRSWRFRNRSRADSPNYGHGYDFGQPDPTDYADPHGNGNSRQKVWSERADRTDNVQYQDNGLPSPARRLPSGSSHLNNQSTRSQDGGTEMSHEVARNNGSPVESAVTGGPEAAAHMVAAHGNYKSMVRHTNLANELRTIASNLANSGDRDLTGPASVCAHYAGLAAQVAANRAITTARHAEEASRAANGQ